MTTSHQANQVLALYWEAEANYARIKQELDALGGEVPGWADLSGELRECAGRDVALHQVLLILGVNPDQV